MAPMPWQKGLGGQKGGSIIPKAGATGFLSAGGDRKPGEKKEFFTESTALKLMKTMSSSKGPSPTISQFSGLGQEKPPKDSMAGTFAPDFSSDLGRKKFGFSREEIDSTAYYEGQFKLYQRSGQGTLHFPDTGAKYVGQFADDAFHGEGYRVWADGSEYHGQWVHGQKQGKGEFTSPDQLKYAGQWERGRRHGFGRQEYANGDNYEGWWYNGMCSGIGTYNFGDGSRYEGIWANGRYDGNGVLIKADGIREKHVYKGGVLHSRDVIPMDSNKHKVRQKRETMQQPYSLPMPIPSVQLITRETAGEDLNAAPVTERLKRAGTAPPLPFMNSAFLPGQIQDSEPQDRAHTAPAFTSDRAQTAPAVPKQGL